MKKLFLCAAVAFVAAGAYAAMMPQFIITECGTVHQIPSDSTVDEAVDALDYWTEQDCY